jgi:hypothetical protein
MKDFTRREFLEISLKTAPLSRLVLRRSAAKGQEEER